MRDVYAVGIGITSFTRLEYPLSEIAAYPAMMAIKDAGLRKIDHVCVANMGGGRVNHQTALALVLSSLMRPLRHGRCAPVKGQETPLREGFAWQARPCPTLTARPTGQLIPPRLVASHDAGNAGDSVLAGQADEPDALGGAADTADVGDALADDGA